MVVEASQKTELFRGACSSTGTSTTTASIDRFTGLITALQPRPFTASLGVTGEYASTHGTKHSLSLPQALLDPAGAYIRKL